MQPILPAKNSQTSIPAAPWMSTLSGRRLSYSNPQPDQICLEDIATGLSNHPRFTGQTKHHWSVACHTLLCMEATLYYHQQLFNEPAPDSLLTAILLHDASEAYTGDPPTPLRQHLPSLHLFVNHLQSIIYDKYSIDLDDLGPHDTDFLHRIDAGVCYAEAEALLPNADLSTWTKKPHIEVKMAELKFQIYERPMASVKAILLRQLHTYIYE